MSLPFPSAEWAAAFRQQVEASVDYRQAAATWTFGPVALVVKADSTVQLGEEVALWLDLERGVCRDLRLVSRATAETAPFCISGDYARWKAVLRGELEPVKAMLQNKLQLKGQMSTIVKYVNASKELVACATRVPTRFLDE